MVTSGQEHVRAAITHFGIVDVIDPVTVEGLDDYPPAPRRVAPKDTRERGHPLVIDLVDDTAFADIGDEAVSQDSRIVVGHTRTTSPNGILASVVQTVTTGNSGGVSGHGVYPSVIRMQTSASSAAASASGTRMSVPPPPAGSSSTVS